VLRFFQASDRKLAIVGRLLARKACSEACGIPFDELQIKRTKGKKPFLANATPELPCFNFNISHEGGMVVLASEPSCVVGVDVCAVDQFGRRRDGSQQTLDEWMSLFDAQLTPHEWSEVQAPGLDDAGKAAVFRRHWSLKEAFVKARGDGLGFELGRAEFRTTRLDELSSRRSAEVIVDGTVNPAWSFINQELSQRHSVTVARGPPTDIVDEWGDFKKRFDGQSFDDSQWKEHLHAPHPEFTFVQIWDLVPPPHREAYATILES